MKVCLTLICLLFLRALKDGDAAETHARMEGENITVECKFNFSENPIFFCKENCEGENILIETAEDIAQKGRYQTFYESYYTSVVLHVSILELKPSDSGRYRCGFGKDRSLDHEFHLDVTEGETNVLLYVGLSLPVLIVLLATALLIYCQRKRFHQQKGRPKETNPTDLTINTVYEEIRENRENKPPAGEISSVYVYVQPNKPNAAESNEIYSLASEPQGQAKDGEAEYSEVQLVNNDTGSNSGHLGVSDNVTYPEPRLDMSSGSHGNGSNPLYSTITLEQELC
ncbi:uncharacterized protein LOC122835239 isoform X3 [Gambusia affinis]|uniref:uncharacterized protein LOC122835239 isoform X3 n=1 Tax=Gambusia affinis TaxID=33528 RepID=UPI001CDB9AA8|nr:uncharacterized protein LOC122835239 isoform X3 [Gambusia affinis]